MDHRYRLKISSLYLEMFPLLFEYARSSLENDALAEEAVQDTFIVACQKPEELCESQNPKGWLVNTLKNVIHNTKRRQNNAARILAEYLEINLDALTMTRDTLDLRVLYGDLVDTEEFQMVKAMALDGKSHLEIARERGIRVDACRKRLQRAKEYLRNKIKI